MKKLILDELNRVSVSTYKVQPKYPVTLILDNVRSGLNVGSAFRTADAFAIEQIILCGITPKPPHREILKTAIGATESVNWQYSESVYTTAEEFKNNGYQISLVEQMNKSTSLEKWQINSDQKIALVFGNEVNGVSEEVIPIADNALEIPQFGTKHSLNISVSIGIVLWHYMGQILS